MEAVESVVRNMTQGGRIKCPSCGNTRKKKNQKTMGVTITGNQALYNCFHCGISGKILPEKLSVIPPSTPVSKPTERVNAPEHNQYLYSFLEKRGIAKDIANNTALLPVKNTSMAAVSYPQSALCMAPIQMSQRQSNGVELRKNASLRKEPRNLSMD